MRDNSNIPVFFVGCIAVGLINAAIMASTRAVAEHSNDRSAEEAFAIDMVAGGATFASTAALIWMLDPRTTLAAYFTLMLCATGCNVAAQAINSTHSLSSTQLLLTAGESAVGYTVFPVIAKLIKFLALSVRDAFQIDEVQKLCLFLVLSAVVAGAHAGSMALGNYTLNQYNPEFHTEIDAGDSALVGLMSGGIDALISGMFIGSNRISDSAKAALVLALFVAGDMLAASALHREQSIPEVLADVAVGSALVTAAGVCAAGMFKLCGSSRQASLVSQDQMARPNI